LVTALEAAHHLRRVLPVGRWSPIIALLTLIVALRVWRPLTRRTRWRSVPTLMALLSLAATLTLTVTPKSWLGNHRSLAQCLPSGWAALAHSASGITSSLEGVLNVALLVPLGFTLTLACRRMAWPALLMVALPAAIELVQVAVPGRECSAADWMANACGGVIAVLAGGLANAALRLRGQASAGGRPTAFTPP
jgi:VanZ family protein